MNHAPLPSRKLGNPEVAQLIMGQSPSSETYNMNRIGLPFYQGKSDFGLLHPEPRVWCSAPLRVAEQLDTLISVRAPVGEVNLANEKCCLGRGLAAVRPDPSTNPYFLFFALISAKPRLVAISTGTTFQSVNKVALEELDVPFPSKMEQEKIAAVLWKIQRAIETEEKLIAIARELKRSTMHQLFTRGLRGEPQKETEMGMIPESWEVVPLGRHLLLAQYGLSIRGQQVGRYPILRMNCQLDGKTIFRDLQFVDPDQKTFAAFQVRDGDLLFNRTNSFELVGRTSIFRSDREAVFASYLIRLTLDQSEYYPEFVNFFFNQPSVQADLKRLASRGVSQSNISASKLKEYPIPKTSLDEQREISGILQSVDRKIEIHERKRTTLQDLFKTMLHKLMTGEIQVADLDIDVSEIIDGTNHETIRT